ncbi:hypothetical protein V7S43_017627 [Phytophthora oleae]|uniref:C2H2-type domain-containing protein n=1 Tax=Phytophthora oleae TaxID=2107226 RepID=A0ABD3ESL3_9STRA
MASKRKNEDVNVASAKVSKVECEYCGKSYKARGLTRHQNACSRRHIKRREICFESTNVNAFAHILSFLSNQSVVKLQAATGAIYSGSNTVVSAVCCRCEKDELVIANGLCLACNRAKTSGFRATITTTDARKLYGIHDINNVPHSTRRMYHRGYYSLFEYEELERNAIRTFGSKKKWLEHVAPKALRRQKIAQAKRRAEKEYQALLATFSTDFQSFVSIYIGGRMTEERLRERAARFDSVCEKLASRSLDIRGYLTLTSTFVLGNTGSAEEVADSIERAIKEKERRKREQAEAKAYLETLPKEAVDYINNGFIQEKSRLEARYTRYCELTAALGAKDLELRSDSVLCRSYILSGEGAVDDIADTMEEMNFLYTHTSYSSDCDSIVIARRYNPYYWSDSDSDDGSYWSDDYDDYGYKADARARREEIKRKIKEQYLLNSQGLTLPANWQRERESRAAARQA